MEIRYDVSYCGVYFVVSCPVVLHCAASTRFGLVPLTLEGLKV